MKLGATFAVLALLGGAASARRRPHYGGPTVYPAGRGQLYGERRARAC